MNHCDFYQSNSQNVGSREINSSCQQQGITSGVIVWCSHKHSPASEDMSRSVIGGGGGFLPCGGDFDKCTISSEDFMDVIPD